MLIKRIIRKFLRIFFKIFKYDKPLGYVFMLHRIAEIENDKLFPNENMKVSPAFLDSQLEILKKTYNIIPASHIPLYLKKRHKKPFIVFTIDDGYKDNLYNALPVFQKHNIPFTVFVTIDFPDQKAVLWWYVLEDLLLKNDLLHLNNGKTYECRTKAEKETAFMEIRAEILKSDQTDLVNQLNRLFYGYKIDWFSKTKELCMTWDEVKLLSEEPLVTIGGHTVHHYNLKQLPESQAAEEILLGNKLLAEKIGKDIDVFAYPFGSPNEANKREYKIITRYFSGLAFIAFGGAVTKLSKRNVLPRIMFTHDFKVEELI